MTLDEAIKVFIDLGGPCKHKTCQNFNQHLEDYSSS